MTTPNPFVVAGSTDPTINPFAAGNTKPTKPNLPDPVPEPPEPNPFAGVSSPSPTKPSFVAPSQPPNPFVVASSTDPAINPIAGKTDPAKPNVPAPVPEASTPNPFAGTSSPGPAIPKPSPVAPRQPTSAPNPFAGSDSTDPAISKPSFVAYEVDGGLDLVTSLTHVQPGAMVACQNYEVARQRGARRIDGYELFDGGTAPSISWLQQAVVNIQFTLAGSHVADFAATNLLQQALYDAGGNLIGQITSQVVYNASTYASSVTSVNVYVVNMLTWPYSTVLPTFYPFDYPATYSVSGGSSVNAFLPSGTNIAIYSPTSTSITYTRSSLPTNTAVIAANTAFASNISSTIQGVPGVGNVNGLFYLKDTVYATRDMAAIRFTGGGRQPSIMDVLYQGADTANETWSGVIAQIKLTSGDWAAGTAAGSFMLYNPWGSVSAGVFKNATVPGSNVATFSGFLAPTAAALYKATGRRGSTAATASWKFCDLGWTVPYTNGGINAGPDFLDMNVALTNSLIAGSGALQSTAWKIPGTALAYSWTYAGTATSFADSLTGGISGGDAKYANYSGASLGWCGQTLGDIRNSGYFTATNFGFTSADVPATAVITGIELQVDGKQVTTGTVSPASLAITDGSIYIVGTNVANNHVFGDTVTPWLIGTYVNRDYGGSQELLGYTNTNQPNIVDPAFGISYNFNWTGHFQQTSSNYLSAHINNVRMRIWFMPQTNPIYFWDGTTGANCYIKANPVQHYIQTGDVSTADAAGVVYFQFVRADGTIGGQPLRPIGGGEGIYVYPASGSPNHTVDNQLGITAAAPAMNVMDCSSLIAAPPLQDGTFAPAAKYQHITKNFYASSGFEAIYGVSGAGPAFYYDGVNFSRILTGLTAVLEAPRHITEHQGHIVLGYYSGMVEWSNTDNVLSFNPVMGNRDAAGIGFGERINGIASLNGDSLAVWTKGQLKMIQGQFDGPTPAYVSIISPTSGGIEYSIQPMVNWMYADFRGITSIGATQKYGDFEVGHLSALVAPFLVPRLQLSSQFEGGSMGAINSVLVRNKNQYRQFYGDGMVLTVTFLVDGEPPQFTTQKYFHADAVTPLTWDVLCVGTESTGRDHIYGATDDGWGAVYELERGTSFNNGNIPAFVVVAGNDLQAPYDRKMFYDAGIHGVAQDYATFTMSRSANYTVPGTSVTIPMTYGSLTSVPNGEVLGYVSFNTLQMEGRSINLRFDSSVNNQFPHAIQSIVLSAKALEDKRT